MIALLFAATSLVQTPDNRAEAASEPLIETQLSNPDPDFVEPKPSRPTRSLRFKFMIDKAGVMTAAIGKTNPQILSAKLTNPRRDMVHMTRSSADVSFLNVRIL